MAGFVESKFYDVHGVFFFDPKDKKVVNQSQAAAIWLFRSENVSSCKNRKHNLWVAFSDLWIPSHTTKYTQYTKGMPTGNGSVRKHF